MCFAVHHAILPSEREVPLQPHRALCSVARELGLCCWRARSPMFTLLLVAASGTLWTLVGACDVCAKKPTAWLGAAVQRPGRFGSGLAGLTGLAAAWQVWQVWQRAGSCHCDNSALHEIEYYPTKTKIKLGSLSLLVFCLVILMLVCGVR